MRRKGQAINIDWTIGLGLFLLTALTTVLFILNAGITGNDVNSLTSKAYEVQNAVEEASSISGSKIPIITRGPENISKIPVDRNYNFGSDAHPNSGSGNIPVSVDVGENRIITVTDAGNITNHISYFSEEVSEVKYNNDISTGDWINNSKISVKPGSPGIDSLIIDGNEILNTDADLGSGTYSINEQELHSETLSGNLKVYNGSSEMILDDRSDNITFNLNNLDTLYWYEDDSTIPLDGTGTIKEGDTQGFTIASDYGITFLGDLTATVKKPDSSTVRAEIDAEELRIRLHNSNYESGKKRIRFYDEGYIELGASEKFSAPYKSKIRQLKTLSETDFENSLDLGTLNYKIGFGSWIQNLVEDVSDWNKGEFNATSATRKDNSGDIGLGYRNGTSDDSLVGYWRMDKDVSGDGGTVIDYSGKGNDGTSQDGVLTGPIGVFGTNASEFNQDSVVNGPEDSSLHYNDHSISFWIKQTSSLESRYNLIIGVGSGSTNDDGAGGRLPYIYYADNGDGGLHWRWSTNISGNDGLDTPADTVTQGEWIHLAGVKEGEDYTIYKNGQELDSVKLSSSGAGNGYNGFKFRGDTRNSVEFKLDEIRLYDSAISPSRIRDLSLYGQDRTFNGNYIVENQTESFQNWNKLDVEADIPEGTNAEILFESIDRDENTIDRQIIDLEAGERSYSINSDSSVGYKITFRGTSNDPTKTWEIKDYQLKYGPELSRGMNLPLDTSTVVLNRGANRVDRNGSFSSIENQVVLWR